MSKLTYLVVAGVIECLLFVALLHLLRLWRGRCGNARGLLGRQPGLQSLVLHLELFHRRPPPHVHGGAERVGVVPDPRGLQLEGLGLLDSLSALLWGVVLRLGHDLADCDEDAKVRLAREVPPDPTRPVVPAHRLVELHAAH